MTRRPVTLATMLGHYPWVVVHLRCHYCARETRVRLARLAIEYGLNAPLGRVLRSFMSECAYDPHSELRRPQKYGRKCGAYCPDVMSPRPPDLPPSLSGLTLIEGGKADMLPAEPGEPGRRRRVGEDSDV
ncbi:hypothetical protein LJR090_002576 [Bosea sp. LjRoot90]|uniref:hypothetical protein n=1 Tax=Bosea sp. LjRoot90 TaxID=3342342 RepID=UPI003ED14FB8